MKKIGLIEFMENRHLYDIMVDPVYAMDAEDTLIYWNRPFLQYTALGRLDLEAGAKVAQALHLDLSGVGSLFEKCREEGRTVRWREIWARGREGEPLSLAVSYTPLWEGDKVVGAVATFKDLTVEEEIHNKYKILWEREREARRRAEALGDDLARSNEELERALGELKVLDKMKAAFIDLVSHELRTPVTGLLASAQLLEHPERLRPEQVRKISEILRAQSEKLSTMINDILDLSLMMGRKMFFQQAPGDADELAREVAAQLDDEFRAARVRLELELCGQAKGISFDSEKLAKVVASMLKNAIGHTPAGGRVVMRSARISEGVQLSVVDSGEGIPAEAMGRIFASFEQVEDVLHHHEGRGLSLAVAKGVIEQGHGGRIWAASAGAGKGAEFHFVIPFPVAS